MIHDEVKISMPDCPFCVISRRSLVTRALGAAVALGTGAGLLFADKAIAQTPGVTSEQLGQGTMDFSEVVNGPADFYTLKITFQPHTVIDWHIHPGPVYGIINAGTLTNTYDLLGCKAQFGAGAAVYIPKGLTHQDRNDGDSILEVISTFIVAAGSPLRVPTDNVPAGVSCGGASTAMPPS